MTQSLNILNVLEMSLAHLLAYLTESGHPLILVTKRNTIQVKDKKHFFGVVIEIGEVLYFLVYYNHLNHVSHIKCIFV